jgi:hypothetical protein
MNAVEPFDFSNISDEMTKDMVANKYRDAAACVGAAGLARYHVIRTPARPLAGLYVSVFRYDG